MISLQFHNLLGCGWEWDLLLLTEPAAEDPQGERLGREPLQVKAAPRCGGGKLGHGLRAGAASVWREERSRAPGASTSCGLAGTPSWRGLGLDPDFVPFLPCEPQQTAPRYSA